MSNNYHATRWTDDLAQQEQFFTAIRPKIQRESKHMAKRYGVETYLEDIKAEVEAKLWQQMLKIDPGGPFAKDLPEATDFFLEKKNYRIREWARSSARKEADKLKKQSGQTKEADEYKKQSGQADDITDICWPKKQSRQADDLANVRQPDLPPDKEKELLEAAEGIKRVSSVILDFTPRDRDIFCKEMLRQMDIDDLPEEGIDQAAKAAGASGFEVRAYLEYHDENGHSSERDRQAWHRARVKVEKALKRAALISLLTILFALSLALLNATHQVRSNHQNDLAHQGNLIDEVTLAHQENLSGEVAGDHQDKLGDEIASTHQSKLLDEIARDHQENLI